MYAAKAALHLSCSYRSVSYATCTVFRLVGWTRAPIVTQGDASTDEWVQSLKFLVSYFGRTWLSQLKRCQPINNAVRVRDLALAFIYIRQMLAEASQHDQVWGIGMDAFDPNVERHECWRGQNLLGKILMYVRTKIRWERPDLASRPQVQEVVAAMEAKHELTPSKAPSVWAAGPAITEDSLGAYDMTAMQAQLHDPNMAFLRAPVTAPPTLGEPAPEVQVIAKAKAQLTKADTDPKTLGKN